MEAIADQTSQLAMQKEADSFGDFYRAQPGSPTLRQIFREALGLGGLSEEIMPYSFATLADLESAGFEVLTYERLAHSEASATANL